ncbi:unnamed protein product, partial [Linum tenue]
GRRYIQPTILSRARTGGSNRLVRPTQPSVKGCLERSPVGTNNNPLQGYHQCAPIPPSYLAISQKGTVRLD